MLPTRVPLDARATLVTAGATHSCAALEDGTVACWGENNHGALGFRSDEVCHPYWRGFCDAVPQRVPGVHHTRQVLAARGSLRTWALDDDGRVVVWPENPSQHRDPRLHAGICRDVANATASTALSRDQAAYLGRRLRVRGRSSTLLFGTKRLAALDGLAITPFLEMPTGTVLIVDGYVTNIVGDPSTSRDGRATTPGILAYDVCRVAQP
jgi:hypothetical protein